jgi:hypothetical protein
MLRDQLPYLTAYEDRSLASLTDLGRDLAAIGGGGSQSTQAQEELQRVLASTVHAPGTDAADAARALGTAIDRVIVGIGFDGTEDARAASEALVLSHGRRQSTLDRAWFSATGMDGGAGDLAAAVAGL